MNSISFKLLADFVDGCTNEESLSLKRFTEEEGVEALIDFCRVNDEAWVSNVKISLDRCPRTALNFKSGIVIDLRNIFDFLSKHQQEKFWTVVCMLIGRSCQELDQKRQQEVQEASVNFCTNLAMTGNTMDPNFVPEFVTINKVAIANRMFNSLNTNINLRKESHGPFWDHLTHIYNVMNPYDKIVPNAINELISSLSSVMPQEVGDETKMADLPGIITQLLQSGTVNSLLSDPSKMKGLLASAMEMLPPM